MSVNQSHTNVSLRRIRLLALLGIFAAPAAMLPPSASGQEIDVASLSELDDDRTDITHEDLTIDEIEDLDVVRDGEVIGEVEEVLGDDSGQIAALVIEYGGNAVGIGDRDVVIAIDEVEFPAGRQEIEISLTDDELAALPEWTR